MRSSQPVNGPMMRRGADAEDGGASRADEHHVGDLADRGAGVQIDLAVAARAGRIGVHRCRHSVRQAGAVDDKRNSADDVAIAGLVGANPAGGDADEQGGGAERQQAPLNADPCRRINADDLGGHDGDKRSDGCADGAATQALPHAGPDDQHQAAGPEQPDRGSPLLMRPQQQKPEHAGCERQPRQLDAIADPSPRRLPLAEKRRRQLECHQAIAQEDRRHRDDQDRGDHENADHADEPKSRRQQDHRIGLFGSEPPGERLQHRSG